MANKPTIYNGTSAPCQVLVKRPEVNKELGFKAVERTAYYNDIDKEWKDYYSGEVIPEERIHHFNEIPEGIAQ